MNERKQKAEVLQGDNVKLKDLSSGMFLYHQKMYARVVDRGATGKCNAVSIVTGMMVYIIPEEHVTPIEVQYV